MSVIKNLIALLAGTIVKDIGEAFDKNFTSKEERDQAKVEMEQKYNERLKILAEMTDADSWLSKNVRPLCLLVAIGTLSIIMLLDIPVDEKLLDMYAKWTGGMVAFYFGVREIVKVVKRKKNS